MFNLGITFTIFRFIFNNSYLNLETKIKENDKF
jgi:hypothetical protein